MEKNMVGWFEIPVLDMDRAVKFYNYVFGIDMERHKIGEQEMAWFPFNEQGVGCSGSLIYQPDVYKPSAQGILIYFTTPSGSIDEDLKKVEESGGKVHIAKTIITPEIGYFAQFIDTEGNKISLHARQ